MPVSKPCRFDDRHRPNAFRFAVGAADLGQPYSGRREYQPHLTRRCARSSMLGAPTDPRPRHTQTDLRRSNPHSARYTIALNLSRVPSLEAFGRGPPNRGSYCDGPSSGTRHSIRDRAILCDQRPTHPQRTLAVSDVSFASFSCKILGHFRCAAVSLPPRASNSAIAIASRNAIRARGTSETVLAL